MHFAVIPLIVWLLIAAFGGGAVLGGGAVAVVMWKDRDKVEIVDKPDKDGVIQAPSDPMTCVDLYYKAVLSQNHKQYQHCVMEPLGLDGFHEKVKMRISEMEKNGLKRVEQPVRGRTNYKEIKGVKGAVVFSISPWTGKEEKYNVVSQGQGWKIVEER